MTPRFLRPLAVAALAATLAACADSADERINAAIPLSKDAQQAHDELLAAAKKADVDAVAIEQALAAKMKLRVIECGNGFEPGWSDGPNEIKDALKDNDGCFDAQDDAIEEWLQLRRVALLLAAPPLRPLPKELKQFHAPHFVSSIDFADGAGVALVTDVGDATSVIDLNTRQAIMEDRIENAGAISPNGRLFVSSRYKGGEPRTQIVESESGDVLATLENVSGVRWVGGVGIVYKQREVDEDGESAGETLLFRDLASGEASDIGTDWGVDAYDVAPYPGKDDHYLLFQGSQFVELAIERAAEGYQARIVGEHRVQGHPTSAAQNLMGDGRTILSGGGGGLHLLDLRTWAQRKVDLEPFYAQGQVPLADPDLVLLPGFYKGSPGSGRQALVYSLSKGTVAVTDGAKLPPRVFYVPSLKANASIEQNAVAPATVEVTGEFGDIATVVGARAAEMAGDNAEELERLREQNAFAFLRPTGVATAPGGPAVAPGPVVPIQGPVLELAKKARVIGIGVYEGDRSTHGGSPMRTVQVRVMKTRGPAILVLTSYEAVSWVITMDPGAEVGAVLLGGYNVGSSDVLGSPARVYRMGQAYHYPGGDGSKRQALDREVQRWTGKDMDRFEGEYRGKSFYIRD